MRRMILLAFVLAVSALACPRALAQNYALPNVNTGCPANCRQITWQTGSDLWNGGTLPNYPSVACSGLPTSGSSTDAGPAIRTCIAAATTNTAVLLPAGVYKVNTPVVLKSNMVLRGAKVEGGPPFMPFTDAAATTLVEGANNLMFTNANFSVGGGSVYPQSHYGTVPTTFCGISGTPHKGDTAVTLTANTGSCAIAANSWIMIAGNDDPTLISATGTDGQCQWCGLNVGLYVQDQIVQVTNVTGSVATLARPLYYTPQPAAETVPNIPTGSGTTTEPAGVKYWILTPSNLYAGFENLRIDGSSTDITANQQILLQGCFFCWVQNVELYVTGSDSGSAHIEMDYGYGDEIRHNAVHDQRSGASGSGYGYYFQFVNDSAKVEDNICFHSRHCMVYQGGGTATATLYNFFDDMLTDDCTYFGGMRTSHGGHPFFNLFEGNIMSHLTADDFWGTSSHDVMFRNWLWAGEINTVWPRGNIQTTGGLQTGNEGGCSPYPFPPTEGYDAIDLYTGQSYYAYVNNVLGSGNLGSTGVWPTWSGGTLSATCTVNNCGYDTKTAPGIYSYGGNLSATSPTTPGASSAATIIRQGNYDYKTLGVAFNDGGTGFTYQASYYYSSKPAFLGSCPYPEQGSDLTPVDTLSQPAYQRAFGLTACSGGGGNGVLLSATSLAGTVTVK